MHGPLAHLVERLICNEEVTGSSPVRSTKFDLTKKQTPARLRRAHGRAFPQGNGHKVHKSTAVLTTSSCINAPFGVFFISMNKKSLKSAQSVTL